MNPCSTPRRWTTLKKIATALIVAAATPVVPFSAQNPIPKLNENCIVSVLNRNTRVKPDGTWVLPNIPANFGLVRARATCVFNGETVSGESAPFFVAPNASVNVPPIVLGPTTPIPVGVTVTSAQAQLNKVGQTSQLTVTALYADNSSRNVTPAATGTQYVVSNPALATTSVDGLVTAVASGTVLIQATHEGTAGFVAVPVILAGADSDGDGIPDAIELDNGLNPNNKADALEDIDVDGLNNRQEIERGTNLRNPDSDGDGLTDGDEVKRGTSPLVLDTDSDGVSDGLEVNTGTDPLNPLSINLGKALKAIVVAPPTFNITVNDVQGVGFVQLIVTGQLVDGRTLDLTSTQRGTNYNSTDLNICNFGQPDGRVFGGQGGTCTITVSNSGHSVQVQGTVINFTPKAMGFVAIPGFANNVDVSGNFAYVAAGSTGLQIVNVSNKLGPVIVASLDTPGNANDVVVVGNRAYVADGASGLQIIDITTPTAPVRLGGFDTAGDAWDVVVRDNRAYVADGATGLRIIDVSNPATPLLLGSIDPPGTQKGVDVDPVRKLAVLASGPSGIQVIDVTNPAAPVLRGSLAGGDARDVALQNTVAYVADYERSFTPVDIGNPALPVAGASTPQNLGGRLHDVAVQGNFAVGADVLFVNGVPVINFDAPLQPVVRARIDMNGDFDGQGIAADAGFLYMTGVSGSAFVENGVNGSSRLFIGQYLSIEDRKGIAPTVSITQPPSNTQVVEGTALSLRATASDDVAVASVTFLLNNVAAFVDTSEPYEVSVTAPTPGPLVITARAVDLGGNTTTSAPVNVTVIPDPGTTGHGLVRDANGQPVQGATVTIRNLTTTTAADGSFSLPGLPTVQGPLVATATIVLNGVSLSGSSGAVAPVPSGTTEFGVIEVRTRRKVAVYGAPGSVFWNTDVQNKIQATGLFTQVDAFMIGFGQPVPTLQQLQQYDAVFVYSDAGFNDGTALGNVLADYMDQGGGVVMATFAFWSSGGLSIQGRIKTGGYLPFTTGSQNSPGNLTLVPVLSGHPILSGVASFNGGTSSYHNSGISIAPGATLVANWSNGQPLVGARETTNGRIVGLNFYPPSMTVRSDFWRTDTNGALLMANALIWVAR